MGVMVGMKPRGDVVALVVVVVKALAVVGVSGQLSVQWRNIAREYCVCGERIKIISPQCFLSCSTNLSIQ